MVASYNIGNLGSGSRTATGIVPLSGTAATGAAAPTGVVDTSNTDWISFAVTITGSATAQVETSFDNGATWNPIYAIKGSDSTTTAQISTAGLYFGNSIGALTRINVTSVSGTFTVTGGTTDVMNAPNGTPGAVSIQNPPLPVKTQPSDTALVPFAFTSTASTNATVAKSGPGNLVELDLTNTSGSTVYLKLYNKASAPTIGTDNPVLIIPIAAGATLIQDFGPMGKRFTTGIAYVLTGAQGPADTTAIAAGVLVSGGYI